jgi:hypothetical protein
VPLPGIFFTCIAQIEPALLFGGIAADSAFIAPIQQLKLREGCREMEGRRPRFGLVALYMFKDQTGTILENVTIIFEDNPSSEYDGHFIYKQIPPPTPR